MKKIGTDGSRSIIVEKIHKQREKKKFYMFLHLNGSPGNYLTLNVTLDQRY